MYDRADRSQGQTTATRDNGHQPRPQPHSIQKAVNETLLCHPVAARADNSDAFYRTQVLYELDCDDRKAAASASGGILFRTRFGRLRFY